MASLHTQSPNWTYRLQELQGHQEHSPCPSRSAAWCIPAAPY